MLTYDDCMEMTGLTEDEIAAISEHEHIPEIVAAELGNYLVERPDGVLCIKRFILDDIRHARENGHDEHARKLELVLKHFLATHPERKADV